MRMFNGMVECTIHYTGHVLHAHTDRDVVTDTDFATAASSTQVQIESARAQKAEHERTTLIQSLGAMRTDRGGATNGIGQPFMLKGTADQDFGEWTHKVCTFMLAMFGDEIFTAPIWAARQRKIVVKTCVASQRDRLVPWITVFGEQGDEDEQIDNIDVFVGKFYAFLVSFTTDAANRIVRNSGEGNGLEAWRRLHSATRRRP